MQIVSDIELTPSILAEAFASMNADEQACFFSQAWTHLKGSSGGEIYREQQCAFMRESIAGMPKALAFLAELREPVAYRGWDIEDTVGVPDATPIEDFRRANATIEANRCPYDFAQQYPDDYAGVEAHVLARRGNHDVDRFSRALGPLTLDEQREEAREELGKSVVEFLGPDGSTYFAVTDIPDESVYWYGGASRGLSYYGRIESFRLKDSSVTVINTATGIDVRMKRVPQINLGPLVTEPTKCLGQLGATSVNEGGVFVNPEALADSGLVAGPDAKWKKLCPENFPALGKSPTEDDLKKLDEAGFISHRVFPKVKVDKQTNANSDCPDCNGTGEIELLNSFVECERCQL